MDLVTRKVFCYNVHSNKSLEDILKTYQQKLGNDYTQLERRGLIYFSEKDRYKYFLDIDMVEAKNSSSLCGVFDKSVYNCILYKLRESDFPYLFDLVTGDKDKINAKLSQALMEQTHFIVIPELNIIVSEFNYQGPKISKFIDVIRNSLGLSYADGLSITSIFNNKTIEKIRNLKGIKSMTFKAGHQGIRTLSSKMEIGGLDAILGTYSNCEDLEFEITIKGKGRSKQVKQLNDNDEHFLKKALEKLFDFIDRSKVDNINSDISKAKVIEFEGESNYPIDLLEEHLVQEVTACKLDDRFKYIDSKDMFNQLFKIYNENKFELSSFQKLELNLDMINKIIPKEAVALDIINN